MKNHDSDEDVNIIFRRSIFKKVQYLVGDAVPMAIGEQEAALVKALQMISARNVSLAAM